MRILNLLNRDHRRGAEAFAVDLGDALASLGHDVTTAALRVSGEGPVFNVVTLTTATASRLAPLRPLRAAARGSDVVIGHGGDCLLACAVGLAGTGVPFVYRAIGDPEYWTTSLARRTRVRIGLHRARAVAAYHEGAATVIRSRYGLEEGTVRVIPKGIDLTQVSPATRAGRRDARAALGIDDDVSVVLYLGALREEKNVEQLIDAMSGLERVELLVVGDGPDRRHLQHRAASRGARVRFLGASEDPTRVLAAADVLGLTSRTEGVPTVALEAALAGLPSVATDVGGVGTVVIDGVTGALVPVGDPDATAAAIQRALDDRARLGDAARTRCLERHDITDVARQWESLLAEVTRT